MRVAPSRVVTMRGIHLKNITDSDGHLPEYRQGAFHIPVHPTDPLRDETQLLPEELRELARDIRSQLEETLDLLRGALTTPSAEGGQEPP